MIIKLIITFGYNNFDYLHYLLIRLHFTQLYFRADFSEFGLSVVIQISRCQILSSLIQSSPIIRILPCIVCIAFDGLAYVRHIYTDTIAIFTFISNALKAVRIQLSHHVICVLTCNMLKNIQISSEEDRLKSFF